MKFQDLSTYGLMAACADGRISGCPEGCGKIKSSYLSSGMTPRCCFLQTNTTQYCRSTIAGWPPALSGVQAERPCLRQYFHTWKLPAVARPKLLSLRPRRTVHSHGGCVAESQHTHRTPSLSRASLLYRAGLLVACKVPSFIFSQLLVVLSSFENIFYQIVFAQIHIQSS